jgi:transcription elongation factor Elf1
MKRETWFFRVRAWLGRFWFRARQADRPAVAPYPDYVTCPHCGEPEVEVWCYESTARCHNCGRTFAHPLPAGCGGRCPHCEPDARQPK